MNICNLKSCLSEKFSSKSVLNFGVSSTRFLIIKKGVSFFVLKKVFYLMVKFHIGPSKLFRPNLYRPIFLDAYILICLIQEICSLHHFHDNQLPTVQKIPLAAVRSSAKQSKKDGGKGAGKNSKKESQSNEDSKNEAPIPPKSSHFEVDGSLKMINEFVTHLLGSTDLKQVDQKLMQVSSSLNTLFKNAFAVFT